MKALPTACLFVAATCLSALPPPNPFTLTFTHQDRPDSLTYFINNFSDVDTAIGPNPQDSLIDSVILLKSTDSSQIASQYKTNTALKSASLFKDRVRLAWDWPITGLTEGTRYFFGMTTRNRSGEWSQTLRIYRVHTRFTNPLGVDVGESPMKGDSGLIIRFLNVSSLNSRADSIKLFFQPSPGSYPIDPNSIANKTYGRDRLLASSYDTLRSFQSNRRYYFTVTCGNSGYPNPPGFAKINPAVNGDTLTTGNYLPPANPLRFLINALQADSVNFSFTGILDAGIESVYVFMDTDSARLAGGYKSSVTPIKSVSRESASGPFTQKPLSKGVRYHLGVAVKNREGYWSVPLIMTSVLIPHSTSVLHAEVTADFNRSTKVWRCSVRDTVAGDLFRVVWGHGASSFIDSSDYALGSTLNLSLTGDSLFLRLKPASGLARDTLLKDFVRDRIKLAQGTARLDFSRIAIETGASSLKTVVQDRAYLWVGRLGITSADSQQIRNSGFSGLEPVQYWFKNEIEGFYQGDSDVYYKGLVLKYLFDTSAVPLDPGMKFYRLHRPGGTARLEYLGGAAGVDNTGKGVLTLDSFRIPSLMDTFTLVIARDLNPPAFDYPASGITLNPDDSTGRLIFSVSDNTVNMDASIRIFTYGAAGNRINLFDTVTTALQSSPAGPSPIVVCTLSFSGDLKAHITHVKNNGLFCAMAVSDGRRRFLYACAPPSLDSASGDINLVQKAWRIVSLPWSVPGSVDKSILAQIPDFQGRYDLTRQRIYGEPGASNQFMPFNLNDPAFDIEPGKAFLFIVRHSNDVNLHYTLRNPVMRTPDKRSGYEFTGRGWRLLSLPFNGGISLESLIRASRSDRRSGPADDPADWQRRIWKLNLNFDLSVSFQTLSSRQELLPGAKDGFLVYLFDNDTLVLPVISDTAFLPPSTGPSVKAVNVLSDDWRLNASLSLSGNEASVLDNFTSFGVKGSSALSLPDMIMPGSECIFGLKDGDSLSCVQVKPNNGRGEIFTLTLKTGKTLKDKDLEIHFTDLKNIPDRLLVYLDDPAQGYSVNLRELSGRYCFFFGNEPEREFRILVGDSDFVRQGVMPAPPGLFALSENVPNPFNPMTSIGFSIPDFTGGAVSRTRLILNICNLRGQVVTSLLDKPARPGVYRIQWDGKDDGGRALASGLFIYRLTVFDRGGRIRFTDARKMILVK